MLFQCVCYTLETYQILSPVLFQQSLYFPLLIHRIFSLLVTLGSDQIPQSYYRHMLCSATFFHLLHLSLSFFFYHIPVCMIRTHTYMYILLTNNRAITKRALWKCRYISNDSAEDSFVVFRSKKNMSRLLKILLYLQQQLLRVFLA